MVRVKTAGDIAETDKPGPCGYEEDHPTEQKPKRARRPTPSVNENLEPAYDSAADASVNLNFAAKPSQEGCFNKPRFLKGQTSEGWQVPAKPHDQEVFPRAV